ncbi:Glutamyl aminopeptidase [Formica fusca]
MPIQAYKSVNNYTMCTVFQMTPPMSPNDVAIVIFDQILNKTDTVVDIWCRPHLVLYMLHAQYVAGNVIKYLKNNFEILRTVPKMNYVAIPSLENRIRQTWGLVLYK